MPWDPRRCSTWELPGHRTGKRIQVFRMVKNAGIVKEFLNSCMYADCENFPPCYSIHFTHILDCSSPWNPGLVKVSIRVWYLRLDLVFLSACSPLT